jgi:carbonic anhydrase
MTTNNIKHMETLNKDIQQNMTPQEALQRLLDGNERFTAKQYASRDLLQQIDETSGGQFPFAAVLGCIDSRVPVEVVFDQGVGDIFSARVAGNIVNEDILGSLEYACKVAGSKLILVLGHTKCGAVTAACKNVELGNITALLSKIKPAVDVVIKEDTEVNDNSIEQVSLQNIKQSITNIKAQSAILKEMEANGDILIKGAVYDVANGKVNVVD